jgi:4'-phosphopantetheinyl transferase
MSIAPPRLRELASVPALAPDAVHVWLVDLARVGDARVGALLSPEERRRAAAVIDATRRAHIARARGVLRLLLGHYLERDPHSLRLARGAHGKLCLAEPRERERRGRACLCFNLAHARGLAAFAFSPSAAVGIDLETAAGRHGMDEAAVAARALGAPASRRLRGLAPTARRQEFVRAWVRHEAQLKCEGVGLWRKHAGARRARARPWTAEIDLADLAPGFAAAVCVARATAELRCWTWAPATAPVQIRDRPGR